jgi:glutamate carboxypeptidase
MLVALRALKDAGLLDGVQVTVMLSGDEESVGAPIALARADLKRLGAWADLAVGFEDGAGDVHAAVVGRRSSSSWTLRTWGVAAHSSQIFRPEVGSGAIFEAARVLQGFHDALSTEANLTVSPGAVVGGTSVDFDPVQERGSAFGKENVVAQRAVVRGDLRTLTPEQLGHAHEAMQQVVAHHLPRTGADLVFEDRYPPMPPTAGNRRLLALLDQASRDVGAGAMSASDPARAGAADISFTAGLVPMAVDGLGVLGTGGHTASETADLTTLPVQAKRVGLVLARLAGGATGRP